MYIQLIRVNDQKLRRNSVPPFNLDFFSFILKSSEIDNSINDMVIDKLKIEKKTTHIIIECYSYHSRIMKEILKKIPENINIFSTGNFIPSSNRILSHIPCFDIDLMEKRLNIKLKHCSKDFIPFNSHKLKYKFLYPIKSDRKIKWTYTLTGSGCPGKCKYCSGNIRKSQKFPIKNRDINTIIKELKLLTKNKRNYICFEDDNFLRDKGFTVSLLKKIISENINIKWNCQARADDLDDEYLISLMKRTGCIFIRIGCESVSPAVLNKIGKGKKYRSHLLNTCSLLKKYKIPFNLLVILGLPFDSLRNTIRLLSFIIKTRPFLIQLHNFVPYEDSFFGKKLGVKHNLFHYNFFKKSYAEYNWMWRACLFYVTYIIFFFIKLIDGDLIRYYIFFMKNPSYLNYLIFGTKRRSL